MMESNTTEKKPRRPNNYRASDMDIDKITMITTVSPISRKHDVGRTSIPRPVMLAIGIDIGDTLTWTVDKKRKSIEIKVKKQVATY